MLYLVYLIFINRIKVYNFNTKIIQRPFQKSPSKNTTKQIKNSLQRVQNKQQMSRSLTNSQISSYPISSTNYVNYKQACQRIIGLNDRDRIYSCEPHSRLSQPNDPQIQRLTYKDIQSITKVFLKDRRAHQHNLGVLQNIKGKMYCLKLGEVSNFKEFSHYFYTSQYRRKYSKNEPTAENCLDGVGFKQKFNKFNNKNAIRKEIKNSSANNLLKQKRLNIKISTESSQNVPQYPQTNPQRGLRSQLTSQIDKNRQQSNSTQINTFISTLLTQKQKESKKVNRNSGNCTNQYLNNYVNINLANMRLDDEDSDEQQKDWKQMTSISQLDVDDQLKEKINKFILPVLNSSNTGKPKTKNNGQLYNKEKLKKIEIQTENIQDPIFLKRPRNQNQSSIKGSGAPNLKEVSKKQGRRYYSVNKIL